MVHTPLAERLLPTQSFWNKVHVGCVPGALYVPMSWATVVLVPDSFFFPQDNQYHCFGLLGYHIGLN